ncbi:MAG TPA: phospholipid carrier-dependent glycosyltransferase [Chloroflexi bacterium]|nr:phospholipid carrier-dependent glycosyltransferase [Chloroflexota bacterium]
MPIRRDLPERSIPWPIAGILLAFVLLAGAVSVVNPLFESTDEIRHYRYIRRLVVEHRLPVQGAERVRSQSHHPPLYYLLSALASGWVPSPHTPEYQQPINPFWGYRLWEVSVDNKLQYWHGLAERFPFREGYLAAVIPRWVNVLLGAVTVWLTYRLGRRVWREHPALAWGAAALVAFNPQFLYLSGAMNNDIIAAATGTAVLLVSLEVAQEGLQRDRLLRLGLAYGLALLAKFHLVTLGGIIALALALGVVGWSGGPVVRWSGGRALGRWLGGMGVVLGVAALLAGWWFLRNWWLYGDPTGLNKVNELWLGRPAGGNWWALWQGLPYLWSSLWGRFGYGQIPLPQPIYSGLLAFVLLALGGYLRPRRAESPTPILALGLLLTTVLAFTAVVFYYILIQPAGPMGRFLFPALPAFAVLLVGGLHRWLRRPVWTAGGVAVGMGLLALVALGGYLAPAVRSPPPAPSPPPGRPLEVRFGDVARLLAVEVHPTTLRPGEPLFVTVTWEPLRRTERPYTVYVHLIDEADVLIAQRDTWPGLGRAPTTGWQPGRPFVDTYRVDLPETAYAPDRAAVRVGLYEATSGRLPAFGSDGEPLGDGVAVGTVTVEPRPGPWPNPLEANFGDEIALVGYRLEPRTLRAGETFTLTLYWRPLKEPRYDYLVFAQVIDPAWQVWGSRDGAGPGWTPGQVVEDVRRITLRPDTPPGSYPIQVGLFHGETGRLPVLAPDGHHKDERVLLGPVRVRGEGE